jgi:hypothetical protein
LQVPCPSGLQRFQCGANSAPDIGPEAFFGLAFVAEFEGAQFVVGEPQALDVAVVEGAALALV